MPQPLIVEPHLADWSGDPLYWGLVYLDRELREPAGNASIRLAPRGAHELRLLRPDGRPVLRVDLDRGRFRPIFYRRRWLETGPGARGTGLQLTVFGRGLDGLVRVDTALWAALDGHFIDCPAGAVDAAMIRLQIEG